MRFRFLSHTADAKFRAYGKTLEEAFANAAVAMATVMYDPERVKPLERRAIHVEGIDEKSLLLHFLDQLLFLFDSEFFWTREVSGLTMEKVDGGLKLSATAVGDINTGQYERCGGIKAVTYNGMEIVKGKTCSVQVVVDV